ncbi:3224_t:CDS:2, partial [Diversispora eburnea]
MERTCENFSQERFWFDLTAKLDIDVFPLKSPLDPPAPKDEYQAAIAKAKATEYTKKARQAAYVSAEQVQKTRRRLGKTAISIIKTVQEVAGAISKAYVNQGQRSALTNNNVKLRLGIALFNAGMEKKPYYNDEYEKYALGQQEEEPVDAENDGVTRPLHRSEEVGTLPMGFVDETKIWKTKL